MSRVKPSRFYLRKHINYPDSTIVGTVLTLGLNVDSDFYIGLAPRVEP